MTIEPFDLTKVERHQVTDRASWLALRAHDVTASDIGAICGADPYRSPLRIYSEKTGAIEPAGENELMQRGRWMEPAALFALQEKRKTWDARKATIYLRDPTIRLGATPDVVAIDPEREGFGNVQVKVVARRKFNTDWCGIDDEEATPEVLTPPLNYRLQTITEAKLLGASWAALVALVIGEFTAELHIVDVDIHEGAWLRIRDEAAYFWRCVEAGVPPQVDPRRDGETIEALYPRPTTEAKIDLSRDNELPSLLAEREEIAALIKASEARKDEINTVIKDKIRESAGATLPGWSLSWTESPASTFTVTRKAARSLRVTKKKAA